MIRSPATLVPLLAAALLVPAVSQAEDYPSRPIRLIVPWPAGTGADIAGRILGQHLAEALGQNVVVDNRGGASGTIGSAIAAREAPDGYTLLFGNGTTHGAVKVAYPKLTYDPLKHFTPISLVNKNLLVIVAARDFPATTIPELVKHARAHPGKVSYGTPGVATPHMLAGELLKARAGIDMVHVPYKGGGQVMSDLLGGHIQVSVSPLALAAEHYKTGRVKILAVTDQQRISALPNVPSLSESYPGIDIAPWSGLFGPSNLPASIVRRVNRETVAVLNSKALKASYDAAGFIPTPSTPGELRARVSETIEKWHEIVRGGVKVSP